MKLSMNGAAFIIRQEGFVPKYYLDPVGVPTLGTGFTWRSNAFREWWGIHRRVKFAPGVSMTKDEALDALIFVSNEEYGKAVNDFLDRKVSQHVFDGMVSMVFNCGAGALKWRWAAAIDAGNLHLAASLLKTTAVTAQGKRLAGLVRRRREEADLIENGIYAGVNGVPNPAMPELDAMSDGVLRRRERGPAVDQLLKDLASVGYYNGAIDGVFGYGAEQAVLNFQRKNGLKADGIAGPATLSAIKRSVATKVKARKDSATTPVIGAASNVEQKSPKKESVGIIARIIALFFKGFGK